MSRMARWIAGALLVAAGVVLLFIPWLPGIPLVIAGLALLSIGAAARARGNAAAA